MLPNFDLIRFVLQCVSNFYYIINLLYNFDNTVSRLYSSMLSTLYFIIYRLYSSMLFIFYYILNMLYSSMLSNFLTDTVNLIFFKKY